MRGKDQRLLEQRSKRRSYWFTIAAIAMLPGLAARGETVNPTPSPDKLCSDGRPRLIYDYGDNAPVPDNATRVECGEGRTCYAIPQGFCFEMVQVREVQRSADLPQMDERGRPPPPGANMPPPSGRPPMPVPRRPTHPFGAPSVVAAPETECVAGKGWDFETTESESAEPGGLPLKATFEGWKPDAGDASPFKGIQNVDQDMPGAPVYGNAAPISGIRPPGWSPQIANSVGGDYWLYSQSVNQHGYFWLSSKYRRYSWGQQPGSTWDDRAVGMLQSPECRLNANFLTFRMSGARSSSQRIEVQVRGASTRDYFGIKFQRILGDNSDLFAGQLGHASQVVSIPSPSQLFPPSTDGWTTVRSVTSEDDYETDWMQLYVFNLSRFRGAPIRIRVIDDRRQQCALVVNGQCREWRQEHINADHFVLADSAPEGVRWMVEGEGETGFCARRERCEQVGVVDSKPPLWGFTDAHAHPMANLAFGGHVLWGDVSDSLEDVYDCSRALPPIAGPGGRAGIPQPSSTSRCYMAGDFDFILTGIARTVGCAPLTLIPFVGIGVANICQAVVASASVALLTTPVVTGLRLHGAEQMSSGAVRLGPMFSEAWLSIVRHSPLMLLSYQGIVDPTVFAAGLIVETDSWSGVQSNLPWYPNTESAHSYTGIGKLHTAYQANMIRRAHAGGMRLAVWDVVNSRALALVADGNSHASDWQALKDQTDAAKRILSTSLSNIAALALTPDEAEAIIRSGRMAVILGSEVDELGRPRPDGLPWPRSPRTPGDSIEKQVADLWELGIRKVTPVHAVNNPIGGPAIFSEKYVANNHYINGTPLDGEPSFFELPAVRFFLDRTLVPIETIGKMLLMERPLLAKVGDDGKEPWNPEGWFEIAGEPSQLDGIIDSYDQITYRIGQSRPTGSDGSGRKSLQDDDGAWLPPSEILGKQVLVVHSLTDLSSIIRPSGGCDLYKTVMPEHATSFGPTVDAQYTSIAGHRNKLGLYKTNDGQDGTKFLRAMMKRGMLIDVDHMSQRMRLDVYALTAKFAEEAGRPRCALNAENCADYPVIGVHSTIRGFEKEGSGLPHLVAKFGSNDEATRTAKEMAYVAARGGTIGVFPRPTFIPPVSDTPPSSRWHVPIPHEVKNDCDGSSKTFALKYLAMMSAMKGRGLTLTTDFNGLAGTIYPRFGRSIAGKMACNQGGRIKTLPGNWLDVSTRSQEIESSGIWYADYASRSPVESNWSGEWVDPVRQPPNRRWKQVVARAVGDVREDRAPRFTAFSDGTPINDTVFYNDFGPDNAFRSWKNQDGNRPGAQMFPMARWVRLFDGWDYNLDGFQHIGLAPDLLQDMRNVGVQWEQMEPLMHGAHDFISTWRRSVDIGRDHRS